MESLKRKENNSVSLGSLLPFSSAKHKAFAQGKFNKAFCSKADCFTSLIIDIPMSGTMFRLIVFGKYFTSILLLFVRRAGKNGEKHQNELFQRVKKEEMLLDNKSESLKASKASLKSSKDFSVYFSFSVCFLSVKKMKFEEESCEALSFFEIEYS